MGDDDDDGMETFLSFSTQHLLLFFSLIFFAFPYSCLTVRRGDG